MYSTLPRTPRDTHAPVVAGAALGPPPQRARLDDDYDESDEPGTRSRGKVGRGASVVNGGRTSLSNYMTRVANGARKRL